MGCIEVLSVVQHELARGSVPLRIIGEQKGRSQIYRWHNSPSSEVVSLFGIIVSCLVCSMNFACIVAKSVANILK